MRVLVCGGRDYNDKVKLYWELGHIEGISCIITGAARGADYLAEMWAMSTPGMVLQRFPADWKTHGKAAGPIRNQKMLDEGKPDLVVKGTADMVARAQKAGVQVKEIS
jgi:hypothetical protein